MILIEKRFFYKKYISARRNMGASYSVQSYCVMPFPLRTKGISLIQALENNDESLICKPIDFLTTVKEKD
jgi:hypothetical protein